MEEDIHVGSASDIEMGKDILHELYTEVRQMPSQQNGSESRRSECCIYRVPKPLRDINWKAYGPLLLSIGPLHRENKSLETMEMEKLKYLKKLTERDGMDKKKMCDDIVISIKNQEERLRYCYSEKFKKIKSDDFAKMILLDAVFIIEFFLESNDDTGPKRFKPRMTFDIREDLMLLENQLPLFIIEEIYDQVYHHSSDNKHKSFLDLATCYLREEYLNLQVVETSPGVEKETSPDVKKEPRHLTDLLRNLMLSRAIQRTYSPDLVKLKYSAVMLLKAGVRFDEAYTTCLIDITFDKGVLTIPQLEVDHNFERRIRNIMALEQCCYSSEAYICSYIKFMEQLIDSAEDVGLLVHMGIIVHGLGDDAAVSNMINNLCENIGDNNTCFHDISRKLNEHYRDIETGDIVERLHDKMELISQQDMAKCCIYRVPDSFRNVRPEAYTPRLISIGPLHRGDERLKGMEEQKWRYFKEFAERYGTNTKKIKDLVICIQDNEACIRACYSENFNEIESRDFIEMILLDAVFIIEFFQHSNDDICFKPMISLLQIADCRVPSAWSCMESGYPAA